MSELPELAAEISELIRARASRFYAASNFIKIVLVIGGSVVAGVAHFMNGEQVHGPLPLSNAVGIFASVLVGIGGVFLFIADRDTSSDLEAARKAIETATETQLVLDREESGAYEREREHAIALNRAIELYAAMDQMRSVVHSVLGAAQVHEIKALEFLLESCSRSISIASGFLLSEELDPWALDHRDLPSRTRCRNRPYYVALHCPSSLNPCDISRARVWPEGVGVAGAAYASGIEIVVPDIQSEEIGNRFDISTMARGEDKTRYRSLAAFPVNLDSAPQSRPWGVVTVSSDQPGHFHSDHRAGIRTIEGARALTGMVAVIIQAKNATAALAKT